LLLTANNLLFHVNSKPNAGTAVFAPMKSTSPAVNVLRVTCVAPGSRDQGVVKSRPTNSGKRVQRLDLFRKLILVSRRARAG
jgi:hypothetical protein